ncbi:MAG: hypothetical protein HFG09_01830 [Oscillibacter sp.]|nr:hypothetical protein [Oscillibacter sp.]
MRHIALFVVLYALALGVTGVAVWLGMWYPQLGAALLFLGLPLLPALSAYGLLRQADQGRQLRLLREQMQALEDQQKSE